MKTPAMSCNKILAAAFFILLHQRIPTEAQIFHQSEFHRPTAFHNKWRTESNINSADDYKATVLKTVDAIRKHPFAQAVQGLDHQERTAATGQLNQIIASLNGRVSADCFEDLSLFVSAIEAFGKAFINGSVTIEKETEFSVRQLDSFGKIPPGILELNTMFFGNYEECLSIDLRLAQSKRQYQGKFCTAYVPLTNNGMCPQDIIDPNMQPGTAINWHWCLPNSCEKDDLPQLAHAVSFQNKSLVCGISCLEREFPMDAKAIIWTSVCGVIIALVALGTTLDIYWYKPKLNAAKANEDTPFLNSASRALLAFSMYTNGVAIMDMSQKSGQIHCINCIRVISMLWVMLGHCYEFVPYINNLITLQELPSRLDTLTITNAYFSVDSFFFLSGLLLGFLFFKEISKHPGLIKKPTTWIMFYVHRYLRLTPTYAFALAAYAIMLPYWTGGIWWRQNDLLSKGCYDSWWSNMLYVNNYVMQDKQCMGIAWYLAADMQMHLFAPIVLIALWKSPMWGFAVSAALVFCSTAANIYTTFHNHLKIYILGSPNDPEGATGVYGIYMYNAAWIRFIPYLQGLLLGFILFRNGDKRVRIHWMVNLFGWIVCLCLMPTLVYGPHYTTQGHLLDLWVRASYYAFSRPAWGLCLCWIVFSCYYGYGGIIGKFLSWHIWLPFSRLTYAAYLVHETLLFVVFSQENQPIHFNGHIQFAMVKLIPLAVFSYFVAFFISTMVEIPLGKLESQLFESKRKVAPKNILPQALVKPTINETQIENSWT